jgi:hypothetical protein
VSAHTDVRAPLVAGARRLVSTSLVLAAAGLAALAIGLRVDAERAWFAYLDAWLFGTSLAIGALLVTMIGHASKGSWMVMVRRPMESVAATLPLFALLFVPIAFGLDRIYPWAAHGQLDAAVEQALAHKRAWLNRPFFVARTGLYFLVFCVVAGLLRAWSRENDVRPRLALVLRMRRLSGGALPLVGLTLTWASFDWSMSLQPAWYSTIFGFYFFAGAFVGAIALACVMMTATRPQGSKAVRLSPDHSQALGRVLFAMIVFWAYVSFSQLIVYWMGDIPEEVTFYLRRTEGSWTALTYVLVFGHFVVPFFALLNRRIKRRPRVLAAAGAWILLMHFLDVYWQVLPVHDEAGVRPHWLDLGAVLFVGGLSCALVVRRYGAAPALPLHVPELVEGLDYEAAV